MACTCVVCTDIEFQVLSDKSNSCISRISIGLRSRSLCVFYAHGWKTCYWKTCHVTDICFGGLSSSLKTLQCIVMCIPGCSVLPASMVGFTNQASQDIQHRASIWHQKQHIPNGSPRVHENCPASFLHCDRCLDHSSRHTIPPWSSDCGIC